MAKAITKTRFTQLQERVRDEIVKVKALPMGKLGNYALSYDTSSSGTDREDRFNFSRLESTQKAEYILAIAEVALMLRFIIMFFSSATSNLLAKAYELITLPLVVPFMGIFGRNPQYGLIKSELETLGAMFLWAVVVWAGIAVSKLRERMTHAH